MIESLRWSIANMLDRYTSACWADLVTWAMGHGGMREAIVNARSCRKQSAKCGLCYCGKHKDGRRR